jgi:hypothetical protein
MQFLWILEGCLSLIGLGEDATAVATTGFCKLTVASFKAI